MDLGGGFWQFIFIHNINYVCLGELKKYIERGLKKDFGGIR